MTFPFNSLDGLIIIQVELWGPTGSYMVRLALDTGATDTTVNLARLIRVGYDPRRSASLVPVTTGSGVSYAPLITISKIMALGQERSNFPVLGHTLPPTAGVDGVLGLDFFRDLILTLDFRAGQITIA